MRRNLRASHFAAGVVALTLTFAIAPPARAAIERLAIVAAAPPAPANAGSPEATDPPVFATPPGESDAPAAHSTPVHAVEPIETDEPDATEAPVKPKQLSPLSRPATNALFSTAEPVDTPEPAATRHAATLPTTAARSADVARPLVLKTPPAHIASPTPGPSIPQGGLINSAVFGLLGARATAEPARPTPLPSAAPSPAPTNRTSPAPSRPPSLASPVAPPVVASTPERSSFSSIVVPLLAGFALALACVGLFVLGRRFSASSPQRRREPSSRSSAGTGSRALATVASSGPPPALLDEDEPPPPERDEQIDMLRARIETELEPPFVVTVTSAMPGDGKDLCARLLAESMATAGYRTILVDIDAIEPSVVGAPTTTSGDATTLESHLVDDESAVTESSLSHASFTRSVSKKRVNQILTDLRERFEAVIVSAASPTTSSVGLLFSIQTDTIVVTLRAGRAVKPVDRELSALIERSSLPVLGVVTISPRKIRDKAKRVATPPPRPSQAAIATNAQEPIRLAARRLELPGSERD